MRLTSPLRRARVLCVSAGCQWADEFNKFAPGLKKLLDYIQSHGDEIWVANRSDVSKHWWEKNPGGLRP